MWALIRPSGLDWRAGCGDQVGGCMGTQQAAWARQRGLSCCEAPPPSLLMHVGAVAAAHCTQCAASEMHARGGGSGAAACGTVRRAGCPARHAAAAVRPAGDQFLQHIAQTTGTTVRLAGRGTGAHASDERMHIKISGTDAGKVKEAQVGCQPASLLRGCTGPCVVPPTAACPWAWAFPSLARHALHPLVRACPFSHPHPRSLRLLSASWAALTPPSGRVTWCPCAGPGARPDRHGEGGLLPGPSGGPSGPQTGAGRAGSRPSSCAGRAGGAAPLPVPLPISVPVPLPLPGLPASCCAGRGAGALPVRPTRVRPAPGRRRPPGGGRAAVCRAPTGGAGSCACRALRRASVRSGGAAVRRAAAAAAAAGSDGTASAAAGAGRHARFRGRSGAIRSLLAAILRGRSSRRRARRTAAAPAAAASAAAATAAAPAAAAPAAAAAAAAAPAAASAAAGSPAATVPAVPPVPAVPGPRGTGASHISAAAGCSAGAVRLPASSWWCGPRRSRCGCHGRGAVWLPPACGPCSPLWSAAPWLWRVPHAPERLPARRALWLPPARAARRLPSLPRRRPPCCRRPPGQPRLEQRWRPAQRAPQLQPGEPARPLPLHRCAAEAEAVCPAQNCSLPC
jgi:hypothetical protein